MPPTEAVIKRENTRKPGKWTEGKVQFRTNNIFYMYLKCPYCQNLFFAIRSQISCNEPSRKKFSIWIESDFFMNL